MNDFKEYSAAFHDQNDLMHYGVKGMRWNPNKKKRSSESTLDEEKRKPNKQVIQKTEKDKNLESEQKRNVADTVSLAGRAGLGAAILKGVYDNIPKKKECYRC